MQKFGNTKQYVAIVALALLANCAGEPPAQITRTQNQGLDASCKELTCTNQGQFDQDDSQAPSNNDSETIDGNGDGDENKNDKKDNLSDPIKSSESPDEEPDTPGEENANSPQASLALLTNTNRRYVGASAMFGGWGPHLRPLLEHQNQGLWFPVDAGPSVLQNTSIHYYKKLENWSQANSIGQIAGVQQNVASVMMGNMVYSYGIDINNRYMQECTFSVSTEQGACNAILISGTAFSVAPASNYVGSSVQNNTRVVWWTTVGSNGAAGSFSYIYNFGGGWNGPVTTPLGVANDLAYVHASFSELNKVSFIGQAYIGAYPNGRSGAYVGSFSLGQAAQFVELQGDDATTVISSGDYWVDPESGTHHALARLSQGKLGYYIKKAGESWATRRVPVAIYEQVFRSRFFYHAGDKRLLLILGKTGPGTPLHVHWQNDSFAESIDWANTPKIEVAMPTAGFGTVSAIYVTGAAYQTNLLQNYGFAIAGRYPDFDNQIWEVGLSFEDSP